MCVPRHSDLLCPLRTDSCYFDTSGATLLPLYPTRTLVPRPLNSANPKPPCPRGLASTLGSTAPQPQPPPHTRPMHLTQGRAPTHTRLRPLCLIGKALCEGGARVTRLPPKRSLGPRGSGWRLGLGLPVFPSCCARGLQASTFRNTVEGVASGSRVFGWLGWACVVSISAGAVYPKVRGNWPWNGVRARRCARNACP